MNRGTRLGPYRVLSELGSGSTAVVYLAETVEDVADLPPGRRVALKLLHPEFEATSNVLRRFLREVQVGRALDHPNVVRLLDAGTAELDGEPRHYLTMEYVHGRTLRDLIAGEGRQQESLCRHVGREVACGLSAIHGAGVVHRDVKPENILITDEQQVRLMDLGIAQIHDEALRVSLSGDFIGSILYAAPEQFQSQGSSIDGRADLYALGCCLYELATGVHPFHGTSVSQVMQQQVAAEARLPSELTPELTPFFEAVLLQLLEKSRNARFADADQLQAVLELAEGSPWWRARVRAERAWTRGPMRRARVSPETLLHGRDSTMAALRAAWIEAVRGHGRVTLLLGEPGIGKSRLADEFLRRLDEDGAPFTLLEGVCPVSGAGTAAGAFCSAWREGLGDDELEDALATGLADTPLLVGPFAALLRGEPPPEGSEPLRADGLHTAFLRTAQGLAARRPVLILLEDLQRASEEGLALFHALARGTPGHRILLLGTARPEIPDAFLAGLGRLDQASVLTLERLRGTDVGRLIADALKSPQLAGRLGERLTELSTGNPLFVLEILQSLRETGRLIQAAEDRWLLTGRVDDIAAPPAVDELLRSRVSALPEEDGRLLEVAAVCGYEFDPALVAAVLEQPAIAVLVALSRLERRHRLVHAHGQRCVFDHHRLQEVLYENVPEAARMTYHAALGDLFDERIRVHEEAHGHVPGPEAVEACQHFLAADRGGAALRRLEPALAHLEEGHLGDRAIDLLRRVLEVPGLVEGSTRADLLLRMADRMSVLGRRQGEARALEEAVRLVRPREHPLLACRAHARLAEHLRTAGHGERAIDLLHHAIAHARRGGSSREEAEAVGALGSVLDELGRYDEARSHHESYLSYAHACGDRLAEAKARGNLAVTLLQTGSAEPALEEFRQSLALFQALQDPFQEGRAAGNLGYGLVRLGRYEEARLHLQRSLEASRRVGYRRGEANALGNLGAVHQCLGRLAEAQACFEEDLAIQRECGSPVDEALAMYNCGELEFQLCRFARSRALVEDALDLFREAGYRAGEGYALHLLGRLAAERGDRARAEHDLDAALVLHRKMGLRREAADVQSTRIGIRLWLGDEDGARRSLDEAWDDIRGHAAEDERLATRAIRVVFGLEPAEAIRRELAASPAAFTPPARMEAWLLLWRAGGSYDDLHAAWTLLEELGTHAPPALRDDFLTGSRIHRVIQTAHAAAVERRGP